MPATSVAEELPRPLRLIVEGAESLAAHLDDADGDLAAAADSSLGYARELAARIVELSEPFDAFDILECVRLSESPFSYETYCETEHEGSASTVELVALLLASRGHRAGSAVDASPRPRPDSAVTEILASAKDAVAAGSTSVLLRTLNESGQEGAIRLGAVMREIHLRNVSYLHMLEDTLDRLFGDESAQEWLYEALGFTVSDVRTLFRAISDRHDRQLRQRFAQLDEFAELVRQEMAKESSSPDYELADARRGQAIALWNSVWDDFGDASVFDIHVVLRETGLPESRAGRILDAFSIGLEERAIDDVVSEIFSGSSPLRTRPILRDGDGQYVVVHEGLLVDSIRERVEQLLKDSPQWNTYSKQRGDYLEAAALQLLEQHFDGTKYKSFEYFVPADGASNEDSPARYTKIVESDGLLVADDVAIILEAKAGALREGSRAGKQAVLMGDLRKIVSNATEQATRLRLRIQNDRGLRLRDDTWIDLSGVREIHAVAVSLEDLSGIATVTSHLVHAGLLQDRQLPWTVSLHDLRIVTELVERPAELLLYLRRRTEPEVTKRFRAIDELDFFLEFFATGLYVEPNPELLRQELPHMPEPSVATKRRYADQRLTMLTSRTDQLDAWYFHQLGLRKTPAKKPHLNSDSRLLALVDHIASQRWPGWLRVSTTLLDAAAGQQRMFGLYAKRLLKATKRDGQQHSITVVGGTRAENAFVLVWASLEADDRIADEQPQLESYLRAKKHQVRAAIGACFLFRRADGEMPVAMIYDNSPFEPNEALDQAIAAGGLMPIDGSTRTIRFPASKPSAVRV